MGFFSQCTNCLTSCAAGQFLSGTCTPSLRFGPQCIACDPRCMRGVNFYNLININSPSTWQTSCGAQGSCVGPAASQCTNCSDPSYYLLLSSGATSGVCVKKDGSCDGKGDYVVAPSTPTSNRICLLCGTGALGLGVGGLLIRHYLYFILFYFLIRSDPYGR